MYFNRFIRKTLAILLLIPFVSHAQSKELSTTIASLHKALDSMASIQNNGGWGRYTSLNQEILWGEHAKIPNEWITLQPPATPIIAGIFLEAGKLYNEPRYIEVARKAKDAILALQTAEGGFPHEYDPTKKPVTRATFDDDTTTACLHFLIAWWQHTNEDEDWKHVERVGDFIINAAYPVGLWPQYFPPPTKGYQKDITFNDGVVYNNITALLRLYELSKDKKYLDAAITAGEGIIRLQGGEGEAIWAQQYDPETLQPSWARNFEPPGYSAGESRGVCDALIALYLATGEDRFLAPLPKAFEWYETHKLENGLWARLYEPGTERPVYGRRDIAEKVYDFKQATDGYAWQADWFPYAAKQAYDRIQEVGLDAYKKELAEIKSRPTSKVDTSVADLICSKLNASGFWLEEPDASQRADYKARNLPEDTPVISSATFNRNAGLLLKFAAEYISRLKY